MILLGADGAQEVGELPYTGCCPTLCIDECNMMCNFVDLLPSGPLWDVPKSQAIAFFRGGGEGVPNCTEALPPEQYDCGSMVHYATYLARVLLHLISTSLWPALRESDPTTAVTTLDEWLARLGWQDCFQAFCVGGTLNATNPFLVQGPCGLIPYPVPVPPELELAVKRGIVKALSRLLMGTRRTLDTLNWIIEPLGAEIAPRGNPPPCDANYPGKPRCYGIEFEICNRGDVIEAVETDLTLRCRTTPTYIDAFFHPEEGTPPEVPGTIWPGVLAAECIVRSLFSKPEQAMIFRCDF
jgi:hypothetical protein